MRTNRTKQDLMRELLETKRELSNVKTNLAGAENVLKDIISDRDKLSTQVRTLTVEKNAAETRLGNANRTFRDMRKQRADALKAIAQIVVDLAATPEDQPNF